MLRSQISTLSGNVVHKPDSQVSRDGPLEHGENLGKGDTR